MNAIVVVFRVTSPVPQGAISERPDIPKSNSSTIAYNTQTFASNGVVREVDEWT
jgi:hypothetical protein